MAPLSVAQTDSNEFTALRPQVQTDASHGSGQRDDVMVRIRPLPWYWRGTVLPGSQDRGSSEE